jgi:Zn-dependent peptidase ImmA (M78 family)
MKQIAALAHRLMERYGTSSPFDLCDRMGVGVLRFDLPARVRGLCFQKKEEGGSVILLNSALAGREAAYCCAHELGHVLLHTGLNEQRMSDLTNLCVPRLEREADYFAACLLIDPNLREWNQSYDPLSREQIACLSGLPEKVVDLRFGPDGSGGSEARRRFL